MTQQDKISRYLTAKGYPMVSEKHAYRTHRGPDGLWLYIGKGGSFRSGRNRATCKLVSDKLKERALAWSETPVMASVDLL